MKKSLIALAVVAAAGWKIEAQGPAQVQRDAMMAKGMTDWAYRAVSWVYGHDASVLPDSSGGAAIPGHAIPGH